MSAPPTNPAVNGAKKPPPGLLPRKPKANPLVARKHIRPQQSVTRLNKVESSKDKLAREQAALARLYQPRLAKLTEQRVQNGGWSDMPTGEVQEFPLVTTKRELMEGIRYHIMRLNKARGSQDKGDEAILDVTNQDQFPRPVTLHRRDPRQLPAHKAALVKEEYAPTNPADDAEAERLRQQKADREAQRALDQAQIAPVTKNAEPKKTDKNKKDKISTFYGRNSDEQKKQSGLRYEETLPWHLEDAEGKSGVWVGSYIAGLSDLNCALVIDGGNFRMIPLERYYKFDEKPKFDTFSLDEAETLMRNKKVVKRWVMHDLEKSAMEKERNETRQFLRGRARVKAESATSRAAPKTERQDDYELDMSGDEFQDDDETPGGFEADDEDTKDAKARVRRDALGANLFGEGEESKVEEEEREAKLEKLKRKMMGKKTMKDLMKLEHTMDFDDSDSEKDNNPFTDSSDSESETEEKKDDIKKEEESKKQTEQAGSGAASKGTTTPSGKQKAVEAVKKGKLKRPGSPNLSESSGNESTRKKVKMSKSTSSVVPSRSSTPLPGRPKGVGGATSDGEATAGEGSDGGLKLKKITIKSGGTAKGTPSGSRAGSPAPPGTQGGLSPTNGGAATPSGSPPPQQETARPITAAEIVQTIKDEPNGISLGNLLRKFKDRINRPGSTTKTEWISIVKQVARIDNDKMLRLKET